MKHWRLILLLSAFIPLLCKTPYLLKAWLQSPLDQFDWVFYVMAAALLLLRKNSLVKWPQRINFTGLAALLFAIIIFAVAAAWPVQTLQIQAGILIIWCSVFFLYGAPLAMWLIPVMLILLLGSPSTSYWLDYYLQLDRFKISHPGFKLKLCFAILFTGYYLLQRKPLTMQKLVFPAAVIILLAGMFFHSQNQPLYGDPIIVQTDLLKVGDYLSANELPTPEEQRFYAGNQIIKKGYFSNQNIVTLLVVDITGDIHRIHPTELCLKSGKNTILNRCEKVLKIADKELAVQELEVRFLTGKNVLIYVWYTNNEWSSGNFLSFRRSWSSDTHWQVYQILTPILTTKASAEATLNAIIVDLLKK